MLNNTFFQKSIALLAFLVPCGAFFILYLSYPTTKWLAPTFAWIGVSLSNDIWMRLNKKKILWDKLEPKDKILFLTGTLILLFWVSLPIKLEMVSWVMLFMTLFGYVQSWALVYIFGSDVIKREVLWPKIKN